MDHYPYLPTSDLELAGWLNNFAYQVHNHGVDFGLGSKVVYFDKAAIYFDFIVTDLDQARKDVIAKGQGRDILLHGNPEVTTVFTQFTPVPLVPPSVPAGLLAEISNAVNQIKGTASVYTEAWGNLFRIIGSEKIFNPSTYTPVIKEAVFNDHVDYSFEKLGVDRIAIFKKVNADPSFVKLGEFSKSPAQDFSLVTNPGKPDKIQIYGMGILKDKLIGHPSDIITFSYGGPL